MTADDLFTDKVTQRIWEQYFSRVRRISRSLSDDVRQDLVLELQGHLLESFRADEAVTESERLLNAIDRMGAPEDYLKPMLADRLITRAQRTLSPKTILQGLYYNAYRGAAMAAASLLIGLGYLIVLLLASMAILKPFFPDHTGILFYSDGGLVVGFRVSSGPIAYDPLGYWIVPLGLILAALVYFGLTKLTRILRWGTRS